MKHHTSRIKVKDIIENYKNPEQPNNLMETIERCVEQDGLNRFVRLNSKGTKVITKKILIEGVTLGFNNLIDPELVNEKHREYWTPNWGACFLLDKTDQKHQEQITEIAITKECFSRYPTKVFYKDHPNKKDLQLNRIRFFYDQDTQLNPNNSEKDYLKNKVLLKIVNNIHLGQAFDVNDIRERELQDILLKKPALKFKTQKGELVTVPCLLEAEKKPEAEKRIDLALIAQAKKLFYPGARVHAIFRIASYEMIGSYGLVANLDEVIYVGKGEMLGKPDIDLDSIESVDIDIPNAVENEVNATTSQSNTYNLGLPDGMQF